MQKINMAAVAQKVAGMGAGVVAGGMIKKYLTTAGLNTNYIALGLIAAGVYAPSLIGKGKPGMVNHMGDALIVKGANELLEKNFPSLISGLEDDVVSGYGDDSVAGYDTSDETIVSGYSDDMDGSVSGVGAYIH